MKEKQTFGIQFVGRKNREKIKNFTIFARITVNSAVSEISLKQNIASQDWNPVAGTGKGRKTEIKELTGSWTRYAPFLINHYYPTNMQI